MLHVLKCSGTSPSVHMIDPMHFDRVDHDDVVKKWCVRRFLFFVSPANATSNSWNVPLQMYPGRGVGAEQLGDVLALAGDSSDNIPGVRYY